jgi:hypothetical protein
MDTNPFTGQIMTKPKPPGLASVSICNDALPPARYKPDGKYTAVFRKLKPGEALKCKPADVHRISNALRAHIKVMGITGRVRSIADYGDGKGRVWLLVNP